MEYIEPNSERWLSLEDLPSEEWKVIEEIHTKNYLISNYSRVKCLQRKERHNQYMNTYIMRTANNGAGYPQLHCLVDNKEYHFMVHRLVAKYFVNNPSNLPLVLHKKALSSGGTNYCENLYWGTQADNMKDRRKEGHYEVNENTRLKISEISSVKTNQYDLNGKFIKTWKSARDASRELNIDESAICKCRNGYKKQCGGYQWKRYCGEKK